MNPPATDVTDAFIRGLVLFSLIPSGYFLVDYAIIRPLIRVKYQGRRIPKFRPWWKSGIGVMFVMLGASFFLTDLVVALTLWWGPDYPGRTIVRVALYSFCSLAAMVLSVVYGLESRTKRSVLVQHADKTEE